MFSACRFFQSPQGCFRGSSCSFRHDTECLSSNTSAYKLTSTKCHLTSSMASTSFRTCRFFLSKDGCRNGTSCAFSHSPTETVNNYSVRNNFQPPLPQDYPMGMTGNSAVFFNQLRSGNQAIEKDERTTTSFGSCIESSPFQSKGPSQTMSQKQETICEILPVLTRDIKGPFFAIDVECVATGNGTNDRDVARIAVVDEDEKVVFDQYVKPTKPIVSYLTQLTGITKSKLVDAPALEEALVRLKDILPVESVIVGQSIKKDLEWLMLEKPTDYKGEFDVADLFRLPMQSINGVVRYRYFSLRHVAKYLLGHNIQEADHDPVIDAQYAMKVFKRFRYLHENPGQRDAVLQTLLKTPRTPSFADRYPVIDGVLMRAPRKKSTSSSLEKSQPSCC